MFSTARSGKTIVAGLLILGAAGTAAAQLPGTERAWAETQFIPQDRSVQSLMDRARGLLTQPDGDRRQGLELLQRVIDDAEDCFSDRQLSGSLRRTADALLAELPVELRRLYEQLYGDEARTLMNASSPGGQKGLNDVIRRFYFTRAGGEAAYLKASTEMDRGQFLLAARLFERLWNFHSRWHAPADDCFERAVTAYWKAGFPKQSAALIVTGDKAPSAAMTWHGRPVPRVSTPEAARAWLEEQLGSHGSPPDVPVPEWLVSGGSAGRNSSAAASSPVYDNAWRAELLDVSDARPEGRLEDLRIAADGISARAHGREEWAALSVAEPLVIGGGGDGGGAVIFSSYGRVKAVDARTGELLWQAADADPDFEYLAHGLTPELGVNDAGGEAPVEDFLAQRAWLDATSASLATDGRCVYQVFDSGMVGPFHGTYAAMSSASHPLTPASYNRLRAYDLATEGKLLWEIGGPTGRVSLPLAGTFFLGAPLPVDGDLYVLGEERGQVRLIVLDPMTGALHWSVPLLNTTVDIDGDLERRLAGLSPAESGGIVLCPTGGGLVVAVDRISRSLLWAHIYDPPRANSASPNNAAGFQQPNSSPVDETSTESLLATPRWHGPSVLITPPYALLAPPDQAMSSSTESSLHCVALFDGQLVWSRPRQRLLYLAGASAGSAILVGERHVEAVELATGETIWSLPSGMPSGRGLREGPIYRLPLRGGDLASIDLQTGRLLARAPARSGAELGSLVAAGGRMFSQSVTEIRGFRSLDELQEQIDADLAARPDDPAALAARGEMRLHAGRTDEGLNDLRTSFAAVPDDRVKLLIVDTLLERLETGFAAHRGTIPELDALTSNSDQRIRLIRSIAEGLEAEGKLADAHGRYFELLALEGIEDADEYVSQEHTVRRDRWVAGKLHSLYEQADSDQRAQCDAQASQVADRMAQSEDIDLLLRAVPVLRPYPAGAKLADALLDAIDPHARPLQAEALWLTGRSAGTPAQRAAAISRLIALYAEHARGELVEALLRELETQFAAITVQEGQSGSDLAASLRERAEVAALAKIPRWPTASIHVSRGQDPAQQQRTIPLRVVGPIDPLFSAASFQTDTRELTAFDGFGQPEWTDRLASRGGFGYPPAHYLERRGHRALLFLGDQFRLIDMIRDEATPRVILEDDLMEGLRAEEAGRPIIQMQIGGQGFRGRLRNDNDTGAPFGNTGPLRDELLCYQKGRSVIAVDPFSGARLWHVDNLPPGCEILADDAYVVLIPPERRREHRVARILRAVDGTLVSTRRLPVDIEYQRQQADWGRRLLTKRQVTAQDVALAMYDPVTGENVWECIVPRFQLWAPLDGRDLVVLDETGRLQLLDADTGAAVFETQTELTTDVKSMTVVGHPEEWFVFTERLPDEEQPSRLVLPGARQEFHSVNGPAYAFDRRTHEQLWKREILSLMVDPQLPGRWPLLVLSSEAWIPGENRSRTTTRFQNLLLLNKRTGETVFEGDGTGRWQGTTWTLSPEAPQLQLSFSGTQLAVTFSEEAPPVPEPVPAPSDEPAPIPAPRRIPSPRPPMPGDDVEK